MPSEKEEDCAGSHDTQRTAVLEEKEEEEEEEEEEEKKKKKKKTYCEPDVSIPHHPSIFILDSF